MTRREWISGLPVGLAFFDQSGIDQSGIDQSGIDQSGIDQSGIDQVRVDQVRADQPGKDAMPDQSVATSKIAVAAERSFGLQLLRDIVDSKPRQNVFISPLSVFLALYMTQNGAAGSTRTAMRKTLALPDLDTAELNASTAALQASLKSAALSIANALWADRRFTLAPDFVKLCATLFSARAATLDFEDAAAAAEINDWVKAATNGKIPNIVTPEGVAKAAVILTNAVYFAASWRNEFPVSQTQIEPFHLAGGGIKSLSMMHQPRLTGAYRAGGNFEGAMLYYKQSSMFLYALLPHVGSTPGDVLASFHPENLTVGSSDFNLDLKLPRFNLDFSASLADYLKKMGMDPAFHSSGADFSHMGSGRFFISDVIHKTRLEVDEKGTVAAAATAVTVTASAMMRPRPAKVLVFDRPFVVLIGDSQTGALLFAGAIEEP
jgi:serine protease inhibitor